ncbi:MAG: diaminopimelate decarboxylase [Melioribacteraceae bacterium]|nr:MAG: diaminopimelate decarboxylase [Melioribacteraceae bacterium]
MEKKIYEKPAITKHHSGFMNKFGSSPVTTPKSEVDGVSVNAIADQYGSPVFVLSERRIRENFRNTLRTFKTRYPKVQYAWSYKTNYLNAVCSIFHQEGSWAEVVSEFEYDRARKLGIPGKYIIFNGPDKSEQALLKAIEDGAKIHVDHFDELYKIIELSEKTEKKPQLAIRVNMDTGIYPKWDRFGFNYENGEAMEALRRIVMQPTLKLIGLHTHIGTYMMSAEAYRIAARKMVVLANELFTKYETKLDYIDMGGGFPSNNTLKGQYLQAEQVLPTIEDFADAVTSELFRISYHGSDMPTLILESGRSLIDDAGFLISTIIANKRLSDGKKATIMDGGVNILFTSFWYKHKISPAQPTGLSTENSTIYGPLCMNIDVLREDIVLPNLKVGDRVVIHHVGAYNMTQWMQFITLRPNIVMVMEDGTTELIRESEDLEYIMSREKLPAKLSEFKL